MKKINKKKLLIVALIIFLIVGIVGITNLISYAQNASTVSQEANSKTDYAKVQISFENNYEYIAGDNIKITPKNITITGMNEEGEHPDYLKYTWFKYNYGGRPSPLIILDNQDTNTLTIDNVQPSATGDYILQVNVMRWNGKDYEAVPVNEYTSNSYSNKFNILVLPELHVDFNKDENNKLQGDKTSGYTLDLELKEEYKLNLDMYRLKDGNTKIPYEKVSKIEWKSSDASIVEVNQSGDIKVRAYSDKEVTISVNVTDIDKSVKTVSVKVKVKKVPVSTIEIDKEVELKEQEQVTLNATVTPDNATKKEVTWKIVNGEQTDIVELDAKTGHVTALKVGETKVIAEADGQNSNECTIKVLETPVEEITDELSNTNISLVENKNGSAEEEHSLTIHPKVLPENATYKELTWQTSDASVATFRENDDGSVTFIAGKFDATKTNTCDITATAHGGITRVYHITLKEKVIPVNEKDGVVITTQENGKEVELKTASVKELKIGDTLDLNFKVNPSDATYKNEVWTASKQIDMKPVETDVITIDEAGVVTALKEGEAFARITVTCQNPNCPTHSTYIKIIVNSIPVESVKIESESTIKLLKEGTTTLKATVLPDNATNKTVTWTSDNPSIVEINSQTGEIVAKKVGTASITATADGVNSNKVTVKVEPIKVESLQATDDVALTIKDNITVGEKELTVTPYPENADNVKIVWSSDDESIVEVREGGILVPRKIGKTIIRATLESDPNIFVAFEVTVVPSKAQVVIYTVDQHNNFISELTLRLTGRDEKGVEITPKELTTNGKFDFGILPDGEYTVETYLPKAKRIANASELDIIDYVEVCKFSILNGEIIYKSAEDEDSIYAESLVLVNIVDYPDEDESKKSAGILTAEQYKEDSGIPVQEAYEEYNKVPVSEIVDGLENTNISLVENQGEVKYMLTIRPEVLPKDAADKKLTWTSSREDIAKVVENGDGSVSFVAGKYVENDNTCTIKAEAHNGVKRVYSITVVKEPIPVEKITITPEGTKENPIKLKVGESKDFDFIVDPENATYKEDSWTVEPLDGSPSNVLSVDESGVVTANAIGKGVVRIVVSCQSDSHHTHSAISYIEVIPTPVDKVEIKLETGEEAEALTLQKGDTKQLTATVSPDDATYKEVTWTSSNENVVTVDSNGNITAVGPGDAVITAKAGDKEDTCTVTVPKITVRAIHLNINKLEVKDNEVNGEHKLTFTYSPDNADNAKFAWKSSDEEIAEVKQDGTIVPKKAGKVTITVYVEDDPSIYATCEVTVIASTNPDKPSEGDTPTKPGDENTDNPEIKPDEGNGNEEETAPEKPEENLPNNNVAPKTSDIQVTNYIMLMIGSLIAIMFIIKSKKKSIKSKRRFKK